MNVSQKKSVAPQSTKTYANSYKTLCFVLNSNITNIRRTSIYVSSNCMLLRVCTPAVSSHMYMGVYVCMCGLCHTCPYVHTYLHYFRCRVFMYVFLQICNACMYLCTHVCMSGLFLLCLYVCMVHAYMHACMYACKYVCMSVCPSLFLPVCLPWGLICPCFASRRCDAVDI